MKIPALLTITDDEASYLNKNRHDTSVKHIVMLMNLVREKPLDPAIRIRWNACITAWRNLPSYPSLEQDL